MRIGLETCEQLRSQLRSAEEWTGSLSKSVDYWTGVVSKVLKERNEAREIANEAMRVGLEECERLRNELEEAQYECRRLSDELFP